MIFSCRAAINRLVNLTETTIASGDDEGCIKVPSLSLSVSLSFSLSLSLFWFLFLLYHFKCHAFSVVHI